MIDAERMLGSLVRNAMGGRKRSRGRKRRSTSSMMSRGAKSGLAMGALGVAFGVFEHMTKQKENAGSAPMAPSSLPPVPAAAPATDPLPPVPGATAAPETLPPLPGAPSGTSAQDQALLLVRAMIAAANADHEVDDEERARIVKSLDESGLSGEEREFMLAEIESPLGLSALAEQVDSPDLARQVYLASLMAIEVDTRAEEKYLERLAEKLGLDGRRVAELEGFVRRGLGRRGAIWLLAQIDSTSSLTCARFSWAVSSCP